MRKDKFIDIYRRDDVTSRLISAPEGLTSLTGAVGSSFSLYVAAAALTAGGTHVVIADDKDSAGFIYYDLLNFISPDDLFFFPTSYKRSSLFGTESNSNIVQRTALLTALGGDASRTMVICTYPEALAEKVAEESELRAATLKIARGDKVSVDKLAERLVAMGFVRDDFVWAPGQYSVRGGIVDIFSYGDIHPYRIDLFGDEVDSIRMFDINTQLSTGSRDAVEVVANTSGSKKGMCRTSFTDLIKSRADRRYWVVTPSHVEIGRAHV